MATAHNVVFHLYSFVSVLKSLYWTLLEDFSLFFSWEPQHENVWLHVLGLMLELGDFWLWRLGWFSPWVQMSNACKKLEVTVHLRMQRRAEIAPVVVLHALVRSNKRKFMQIHPQKQVQKKLIFSFSSYGPRQGILQARRSGCCWSEDLVNWQHVIKSRTSFEVLDPPCLRDFFQVY